MRRFVEGIDRGQTTLFPESASDPKPRGTPASQLLESRRCPTAFRCRFWADYTTNMFAFEFPTGTAEGYLQFARPAQAADSLPRANRIRFAT